MILMQVILVLGNGSGEVGQKRKLLEFRRDEELGV